MAQRMAFKKGDRVIVEFPMEQYEGLFIWQGRSFPTEEWHGTSYAHSQIFFEKRRVIRYNKKIMYIAKRYKNIYLLSESPPQRDRVYSVNRMVNFPASVLRLATADDIAERDAREAKQSFWKEVLKYGRQRTNR